MKLIAFRVTNFRSIIDTGWCPFAPDGVTVVVGQNESGKTSLLDALSKTFSFENVTDDDCRTDADPPAVYMKVEVDPEVIIQKLADGNYAAEQLDALRKFMAKQKSVLTVSFKWYRSEEGNFDCNVDCEDEGLTQLLARASTVSLVEQPEAGEKKAADGSRSTLDTTEVGQAIFGSGPSAILFDQQSGLLPDVVDIVEKDGKYVLSGAGSAAAENFLKIAGIELDRLVRASTRSRETTLARANAQLTADFLKFWSQTIGKEGRLQLKCDLAYYDAGTGAKAGKPHLEFWVIDGLHQLFPKQRSLGVRWFVSFYLQLKASEAVPGGRIFLLDEPGANLHSRAQADVLRLINQLNGRCQIVYSTHSPHMIEYGKLYRVLAAQREGDIDSAPTTVIHAHHLGGASRDTLSPVLQAMGADLSQQSVIQRENNVILEEISGFYYLKAFWKLANEQAEAHFIAATGASNVELLANMFLGWGLEFIVVVDDDSAGRSAFNALKRNMFGNDDDVARSKMYKLVGEGIEDIFEKSDFRKFVVPDVDEEYEGRNSQLIKRAGRSKVITAYQFLLRVEDGKLTMDQFAPETRANIGKLTEEITKRLKAPRG